MTGEAAAALPASLVTRAKAYGERLLAAETVLVDPRLDNAGEVIHYGPSLEFALGSLSAVVQAADALEAAARASGVRLLSGAPSLTPR